MVPKRSARVRRAVLACLLLANGAAFAQGIAPPSRDGAPAELPEPLVNEPPAPDQTGQPGILDTLGRWLGDSKAKFDEGIKSTRDAIGGIGSAATGAAKDAAGAAQQATDAIVSMPGTRIVSGRERCAIAANGGPDCADAASALCRAKGFGSGTGLDINSTHKCPAWVWWSNRRPIERECKTDTFVLRAVCQ